jgi:hypothetical protein
MKNEIMNVQSYFRIKLLSGDFKINRVDQYIVEVIIDSEYKFVIWAANLDLPNTTRLYEGAVSFMNIELTESQSIILNAYLKPEIVKYRKEILLAQKVKELEALQHEINNQDEQDES